MILYKIGKSLFWVFLKLIYRFKVEGQEHLDQLPPGQGVLLCSNHISNLDPPLVGVSTKRTLSFMAKAELFEVPVLGPLVRRLNAFPVRRGSGDRQALKTALDLLKDGRTVIMFPEGTRSKTGELTKGLAGVGFIALRTQAAVVPVAITNGYHLFRRTRVVFGQPIDIDSLRENKVKPQEATDYIMAHIKELIDLEKEVS